MPSPRTASSSLRINPSGPSTARGTTQDTCIAFSESVIWRWSSSARCIGVMKGVAVVDAMSGSFPSRLGTAQETGETMRRSGVRAAGRYRDFTRVNRRSRVRRFEQP